MQNSLLEYVDQNILEELNFFFSDLKSSSWKIQHLDQNCQITAYRKTGKDVNIFFIYYRRWNSQGYDGNFYADIFWAVVNVVNFKIIYNITEWVQLFLCIIFKELIMYNWDLTVRSNPTQISVSVTQGVLLLSIVSFKYLTTIAWQQC